MHHFQSCSAQCRGSLNKASLGINKRTFFPLNAWNQHDPGFKITQTQAFTPTELLKAECSTLNILCCRKSGSCFRAAVNFPFELLFIITIYPVHSQAFKPDFSPIFPHPTTAGQQGDVPQRPAHDLRPDRVEIPNPLWDPAPRRAQGAEKESDCQN